MKMDILIPGTIHFILAGSDRRATTFAVFRSRAAIRNTSRVSGPSPDCMFKAVDKWLAGYLRACMRRPRAGGRPLHLLLCVADHFEPLHGGRSRTDARILVRDWCERYQQAFSACRDARPVKRHITSFSILYCDIVSTFVLKSFKRTDGVGRGHLRASAAVNRSPFRIRADNPNGFDFFHIQGQDIISSPWTYICNVRFMISMTLLALFAQAVWVLEGVARQKISYSNMIGYGSLIVTPVNALATLFTLWISEQYLRDKIVWWAALLVILGNCLGMIGGTYLLKGGKT